jgi:hypothetical protein
MLPIMFSYCSLLLPLLLFLFCCWSGGNYLHPFNILSSYSRPVLFLFQIFGSYLSSLVLFPFCREFSASFPVRLSCCIVYSSQMFHSCSPAVLYSSYPFCSSATTACIIFPPPIAFLVLQLYYNHRWDIFNFIPYICNIVDL